MNVNKATFSLLVISAVAVIGCGSSKPSTTQLVTAASGATLKAGQATITIPAGALTDDTKITIREAEPRHQNRVERVELEPNDLPLATGKAAQLSVVVSKANVKVKMHGKDDALEAAEVEDRNHHAFKTSLDSLHEVEVETEDGQACATACTSTQECDDGQCKDHVEDANAKTCDPVCDSGSECDDGACKAHNEVEGMPAGSATCDPGCAAGLECDATDGVCKVSGKSGSGT